MILLDTIIPNELGNWKIIVLEKYLKIIAFPIKYFPIESDVDRDECFAKMDALFAQLTFEKLEINPHLVENDKISKCYELIKNLYANLKIEISLLRQNADNQSKASTVISSAGNIFFLQVFIFLNVNS